ncbi:MAG: ankyrin repeat domain-containing protein [Vicinamibacterales bacterium]
MRQPVRGAGDPGEMIVDLNAAERDGPTALHWAANWDDLDTASLLVRAGAGTGRRKSVVRATYPTATR